MKSLKRLLLLVSFIIFLYALWDVGEKQFNNQKYTEVIETIKSEIEIITQDPLLTSMFDTFSVNIEQLLQQVNTSIKQQPEIKTEPVKKPELVTPTEQLFSLYNIQLGDSKKAVEKQVGGAKRSSYNEYGIQWSTYHENYQNFLMVGYDEHDKVAGLYTNQDLIASSKGIKYGSSKQLVQQQLGKPLTKIQKGSMYYQYENNKDYEMFLINNSYVTVFYDQHRDNTVTAIQIISKELEENRSYFYTLESEELREGFENQLFDLTNAARVQHGLPILTWDERVRETARKHSLDMAQNHYFSHTNLEGQSPFDRMLADEIQYTMAGENLAYGQISSIFAHDGLMNSLGHRKNILQPDFTFLGVGVAFNSASQPYYTENFYRK